MTAVARIQEIPAGDDLPTLAEFLTLTKTRRAVRQFETRALPIGMIDLLLEAARWAPSGFNLQPTQFVVVVDDDLKKSLRSACMNQIQIEQAPAVVVFTGDRDVVRNNFAATSAADLEAGATTREYQPFLRRFVSLSFDCGRYGWRWLYKAAFAPLLRLFKPVPRLPAIERRNWLAKQVMLSTMNFMLAATAAGLATCPMEGFDEVRVRKLLGIPRSHIPILVVPVGYQVASAKKSLSTRLPLSQTVHVNGW